MASSVTTLPHTFQLKPVFVAVAMAAVAGIPDKARAQTYAGWMTQIGITNAVESAANWGRGQLIGVVDTGIVPTNFMFSAGQVSVANSSCAAVSFKCSSGAKDDNGHGTAVASIAAGSTKTPYAINYGGYSTPAGSFIGVAPSANIVAEKVLSAAGSGYSTDVSNGIRKAADAGASVINLSLTYGNTADLVAAVNYAAAKGAFIVWAGGNSAVPLLNGASSSGLSDAAIKRLVIVGSVNASNGRSSFSNTPGSASFVSNTGAKTTYSDRWIMAPGENILAPNVLGVNNAYYAWSGTSMSAPVITGSLVLLESAWPILRTNGTAANLLLATATDLGVKGHDSTFGSGLANLQTAFNPYGALSVTKANGQSVTVSSLTGSLISSGALGSLTSIQSKLANYTAFDTYARNFSVNLSGLIKTPTKAATTNPLPTNIYQKPVVIRLSDGELTSSMQENSSLPTQHFGEFGFNAELDQSRATGTALYTSRSGSVSAFGYGSSNSYSFAKALYNNDSLALQASDFDSGSAFSLAQGGAHFSYGASLADGWRIALSYGLTNPSGGTLSGSSPMSSQLKLGVSYRLNDRLTTGLTIGNLAEESGLLGSTYADNSVLALGNNQTTVVGVSAGYALSQTASLLLNAEYAETKAHGATGSGLFAGTSRIRSSAYGVTYLQRDLIKPQDSLALSVIQPLRVYSGNVAVLMPTVDARTGVASYQSEWASLKPDGREIDYKVAYSMPAGKEKSLTFQAIYQKDQMNISRNNNSTIGVSWIGRF